MRVEVRGRWGIRVKSCDSHCDLFPPTQPGAGESSHHARLSVIGAGQEQHVSGSSPAPSHGRSNNGVLSEQPSM